MVGPHKADADNQAIVSHYRFRSEADLVEYDPHGGPQMLEWILGKVLSAALAQRL
jgi:hypothetical protein